MRPDPWADRIPRRSGEMMANMGLMPQAQTLNYQGATYTVAEPPKGGMTYTSNALGLGT